MAAGTRAAVVVIWELECVCQWYPKSVVNWYVLKGFAESAGEMLNS